MTCPFCKNDLLAGATVCGHCRAYKRGSAVMRVCGAAKTVLPDQLSTSPG
jgi:hypothetical protein